jgi:DHA1 family bicyclomycin/chloramphenicol resistance-like MFS transporter
MGLNSIALDIMLAALPEIGAAMGTADPNLAQLTVGAFLFGAAGSALVVGPLADRFGRRRPILAGLGVFVVAALLSPLAPNVECLLVLRLLQGIGVGTTRLSQAVLRDHYAGSEMAEAMSLSLMLFLILPLVAPLFGQGILLVAGWQTIFLTMGALGALVLGWTWWRLPETLAAENRRRFSPASIVAGLGEIARDRMAVGYGLAAMFLLGALYGAIASAQQVYGEAFGLGGLFPLAMGATAIVQSGAAYLCGRLIRRIGAARVAGIALRVYCGCAALMVVAQALGWLPFPAFVLLMTATMAMFTWADATLGALSMTNLGRLAGTAASAFGALQALGATVLGSLVGLGYDGTPRALVWGVLVLGCAALVASEWARSPASR